MTHKPECEKHKKFDFDAGCPVDICEDITVKVPIEVCAHSEVCNVEFKCEGHTIEKVHCELRGCNKFNVVQKMHVRIPLKFKARCDVGEGSVDFDFQDCNISSEVLAI